MTTLKTFQLDPSLLDSDSEATPLRLGFEGDYSPPLRRGATRLYECPDSRLEIFDNSHSFRWTHNSFQQGRIYLGAEPDWDRCLAVALEWAAAHVPAECREFKPNILPPRFATLTVGRPGAARAPLRKVFAQVCTRYFVDGIALVGPGAKTRVWVDGSGRVVHAYHFWHPVTFTPGASLTQLSPGLAIDAAGYLEDASLLSREPSNVVYHLPPPSARVRVAIPFYQWTGERASLDAGAPLRTWKILLPAVAIDDLPEGLRGDARALAAEVRTLR